MPERLISQFNEINIGLAVSRIGPKDKYVRHLSNIIKFDTEEKSIWAAKPYSHEYALVKAFLGLAVGPKFFDEKYLQDLTLLFKWIHSLNNYDFPVKKQQDDRDPPLFLSRGFKKSLLHRLKSWNGVRH